MVILYNTSAPDQSSPVPGDERSRPATCTMAMSPGRTSHGMTRISRDPGMFQAALPWSVRPEVPPPRISHLVTRTGTANSGRPHPVPGDRHDTGRAVRRARPDQGTPAFDCVAETTGTIRKWPRVADPAGQREQA